MSAQDPELRRMLALYRQAQSPDEATHARVWSAIDASTAAAGPAAEGTVAQAQTPTWGAAAKVIGSCVLIAAGGALLWIAAAEQPQARHAPATAQPTPAHAVEPRRAAVPRDDQPATRPVETVPPSNSTQHARAANAADEPRHEPRAATATVAPAASSSLGEELKLVRAAQAALDAAQDERALRLLRQHARRFPEGVLAEEREAASVDALCRLGRAARARALAARFEERFPGSPHAARVANACVQPAPKESP